METAQLIINIVGFPLLFWVLFAMRNRLKTQEKMLEDHSRMLEDVKLYKEILGSETMLKDVEALIKLKEKGIETERELISKEKNKIIQEMEEKLGRFKSRSKDSTIMLLNEFESASELAYHLMYYVPRERRLVCFEDVKESLFKEHLMKGLEKYPFVGDVAMRLVGELLARDRTAEGS